jgi:hypothetical protein
MFIQNLAKIITSKKDSLFFDSKFIITQVEATEDFIKNNDQMYIEDVYTRCLNIPIIKITNRETASGNCQIISKETVNKLGNKYIKHNT